MPYLLNFLNEEMIEELADAREKEQDMLERDRLEELAREEQNDRDEMEIQQLWLELSSSSEED
jgi:hypothetical protein